MCPRALGGWVLHLGGWELLGGPHTCGRSHSQRGRVPGGQPVALDPGPFSRETFSHSGTGCMWEPASPGGAWQKGRKTRTQGAAHASRRGTTRVGPLRGGQKAPHACTSACRLQGAVCGRVRVNSASCPRTPPQSGTGETWPPSIGRAARNGCPHCRPGPGGL